MNENNQETKFCIHCGQAIPTDSIACPKCGKQVGNVPPKNNFQNQMPQNNIGGKKPKNNWYESTGIIILFLIIFFPVGLFLMWKYSKWSKVPKILISVFFGLIIIGNMGNNKSTTPTSTTQTTEVKEETKEEPKTEVKAEDKDIYSIGEEVALGDDVLIVNSATRSQGTQYDKPKDGCEFVIVNITIKNGGKRDASYNPYDFKMQNSQGNITDKTFSMVDSGTSLSSGDLAAGGSVTGTVVFEQPTGDKGLILKYKNNMFSSKEAKIKIDQ